MHKLAGISQKDAVRVFQKLGYTVRRQGKHIAMAKGNADILVIPQHTEIDAYTMGGIAKDAGLTPEEFRKFL